MKRTEFVALSGLQHLLYCERQAALIHVERLWREDAATAHGRIMHERVDLRGKDVRDGVRVERAVLLACERLGLSGRADTVEYHPDTTVPGGFRPFPVEYKSGKAKPQPADQVQLCGQALCLEEMHGLPVPEGALFYGKSHRRFPVRFDASLRATTEAAVRRLHALVAEGTVPRAARAPKCERCSLEPLCLPSVTSEGSAAARYLASLTRLSEKVLEDE